jgi:hypothetical protein
MLVSVCGLVVLSWSGDLSTAFGGQSIYVATLTATRQNKTR